MVIFKLLGFYCEYGHRWLSDFFAQCGMGPSFLFLTFGMPVRAEDSFQLCYVPRLLLFMAVQNNNATL